MVISFSRCSTDTVMARVFVKILAFCNVHIVLVRFLLLKNIEQDKRGKLAFWGTDGSILASGMLAIAVARKRVPVIGWRPRQMISVQTWRSEQFSTR